MSRGGGRVRPPIAACAALVFVTVAALSLSAEAARPAPADAGNPRLPASQAPGDERRLVPGALLVASRTLQDPNFAETVIVIVQRQGDGTMGLVLNRRGRASIADTFGAAGARPADPVDPSDAAGAVAHRTDPVFAGGPVARTAVHALARSSSDVAGGTRVAGEIHLIASRAALVRRLDGPDDADSLRVYLGYSGWGSGQLEREMAAGAWHLFDADARVVFDRDPATLWQRQIRRTDVYRVSLPRYPEVGPSVAWLRSVAAANPSHAGVAWNHLPSTAGPLEIEGPLMAKSVSLGPGK